MNTGVDCRSSLRDLPHPELNPDFILVLFLLSEPTIIHSNLTFKTYISQNQYIQYYKIFNISLKIIVLCILPLSYMFWEGNKLNQLNQQSQFLGWEVDIFVLQAISYW